MTEKLLKIIADKFPVTEIDAGEMKTLKASGMKFDIREFHAEGLGHVSVMKASGFFGLMKMDTLIINPTEKDLPLYSYDRVFAMGNDTLIVELYDTFVGKCDTSPLSKVNAKYASLPDHPLGEHWYDSIKLRESVSKKGKKKETPRFDELTAEHLDAYLALSPENVEVSEREKREKASIYVEGLLKNGGPSTDVFKKSFGEEKTAALFRSVLFGTEA